MRVLVVDDEAVARRRLVDILSTFDGVEVAGEAETTNGVVKFLQRERPDVILLDIRMPGEDGMSFALRETNLPPIIFTTASDQEALTAFEACAVDYLLKPVRPHRLERALEKVRRKPQPGSELLSNLERLLAQDRKAVAPKISAKQGDTTYIFDPTKIARFYASDKYTCFLDDGQEFLLELSLSALDEKLKQHGFFRVHRGELVSLEQIRAIRSETGGGGVVELASGEEARVSRQSLPALRRALRAE